MDTNHFEGAFFNQFVGTSNILLLNGPEWKKHRKVKADPIRLEQLYKLIFFYSLPTLLSIDQCLSNYLVNLLVICLLCWTKIMKEATSLWTLAI
jgi:hypothetical protein